MADKAVYQYNLAHAAKDRRLRRQLRRRFVRTCDRHSLVLPEAVGEDGYIFCHRCEEVLVSGVNLQIRVRYESKDGVRKRALCYRLLQGHWQCAPMPRKLPVACARVSPDVFLARKQPGEYCMSRCRGRVCTSSIAANNNPQ
ncbi:hypothetical protein KL930_004272 [Ogataea haglerorum]|nr:hypothetical protein KL951_004369 [Ogataea haglerorum]KAG7773759.1 hypothetical protein KL930_004272 [Ogataea haglerorum]KAG7776509.1 hypothetical protein KL922_003585 [Ogataea haglerorum]KAG7795314.1 hypothetical protein KL929_004081 [Ogataea haglerorum]